MENLNPSLDSAKNKTEVVELVELGNGIVQITMKDEEHCNAFSPGIIEGLYKCFGTVAQNKSYKVVILTGHGHYFCSGGTKEELIRIHEREIQFNELDFFRLVLDCEIPVIAAMQGHGIGGGFVFGLYSDLVVLSQESIYTTNFMKYGFTPEFECMFIVPEKLGFVLGQEMIYTAQNYRGKELAKRSTSFPILPRKEVLKYARILANKIADKPRLSLLTLKDNLTSEIRKKLSEVVRRDSNINELIFHQTGVNTKIESNFIMANIQESSHYNQLSEAENVLSQLQSGNFSLENAEKLLLEMTADKAQKKTLDKKKNNDQKKLINISDSERVLSLLSIGEISLENAENFLLGAVELASEIEINEQTLDQSADMANADLLFDYPTVKSLVKYLAQEAIHLKPLEPSEKISKYKRGRESHYKTPWLSDYSPKADARLRLFCFHPAGSEAIIYRQWSPRLPADIEVCPVQLPGRGERLIEQPFHQFPDLIEGLSEALLPMLDKSYAFYGHSMGVSISFELAHYLQQKYTLKPACLLFGGLHPPHIAAQTQLMTFQEDFMESRLVGLSKLRQAAIKDNEFFKERKKIFKADIQLYQSYRHTEREPFDCPITAFGGLEDLFTTEQQLTQWRQYTTAEFKLVMLPGKHLFLKDSQDLLLQEISQQLSIV